MTLMMWFVLLKHSHSGFCYYPRPAYARSIQLSDIQQADGVHERCVPVVNVSLPFLFICSVLYRTNWWIALLFWLVWNLLDLRVDVVCVLAHTHVAWWPTLSHCCQKCQRGSNYTLPASYVAVNICYGNLEVPHSSWYEHHVCCWWQCSSLRVVLEIVNSPFILQLWLMRLVGWLALHVYHRHLATAVSRYRKSPEVMLMTSWVIW